MSLPSDSLIAKPSPPAAFDREWTLTELIPRAQWPTLEDLLGDLLGCPVSLTDELPTEGLPAAAHAAALAVELEPIGWLLGPAARAAALEAAAALLRQTLVARQRYQMASALHLESVHADYLALLDKHHALEQSEARYRALAAELEARVAEQVGTIEMRQRQLYQAERLASVGQLAAGVAHEINNPLGFVRSNLNSARQYLAQLEAARQAFTAGDSQAWRKIDADFLLADFAELLRDSVDGVDRIAAIVRDLKGFSSIDRDEHATVDLGASLAELGRLLQGRLPPGARLGHEGETCAALRCRPGLLQQALFNLLDNALKAIGAGGRITIRCHQTPGWQHLQIVDDGEGIAPEHLARVFDPFFTTRPVGAGIGLGLTLARDIVLAHRGEIAIDSVPGTGTRVSLRLPLGEPE